MLGMNGKWTEHNYKYYKYKENIAPSLCKHTYSLPLATTMASQYFPHQIDEANLQYHYSQHQDTHSTAHPCAVTIIVDFHVIMLLPKLIPSVALHLYRIRFSTQQPGRLGRAQWPCQLSTLYDTCLTR
jgi:hypothetical protein